MLPQFSSQNPTFHNPLFVFLSRQNWCSCLWKLFRVVGVHGSQGLSLEPFQTPCLFAGNIWGLRLYRCYLKIVRGLDGLGLALLRWSCKTLRHKSAGFVKAASEIAKQSAYDQRSFLMNLRPSGLGPGSVVTLQGPEGRGSPSPLLLKVA